MVTKQKGFVASLAAISVLLLDGSVAQSGTSRSADAVSPPFATPPEALYAAASAFHPAPGANIDVIDVRESYEFAADGSSTHTEYMVYKVLNSTGAKNWDSLSMDWAPWVNQRPEMRARVISADGKAFTLDPATISDTPARESDETIYGDERTLRAPLPAIAPGVVVETEIRVTETAAFANAGYAVRNFVQMSEPVEHFVLSVHAPEGMKLRQHLNLLPTMRPEHRAENGVDVWTFATGPVAAYEDADEGLPGDVPANASVEFSTADSWQAVADSYAKIVDAQIARSQVTDLAQRLVRGRTNDRDKVSAILEYLNQDIRYTGIEFSEASVVPHTPSETLARKYGDCKDKATLMVALLRAAGVPANVALLNVGDRLDVTPDLPGMGRFDHAIVRVETKPALWVDATADTSRLGQLPDSDHDRWALLISSDTTELTKIDKARSVDNVIYEEREIDLANQGAGRFVEISAPRGNYEAAYRRIYADIATKTVREDLTDYAKSVYLVDNLERIERSNPRDFTQPFRLTLAGKAARRGWTGLNQASVYIFVDGLFHDLPKELKTAPDTDADNAKKTHPKRKRLTDFALNRPFVAEWHYKIAPPAGFEPVSLPSNVDMHLGPAVYQATYSTDADGTVHADFRFDTVKDVFTVEEQEQLSRGAAALLDAEGIKIKFELTAHRLLTAGSAPGAFAAYRDQIAKHPREAVSHLRRSDGLMQVGLGDAARDEARLAVKLEPKSAFAESQLARTLQYDSVGRWRQPGADYAGAAAAYRSAIALDPDDHALVVEYAILLEYGDNWVRYGPRADLDGAIAEYRKLTPKQLDAEGDTGNLAFALFYAGDGAGAKEVLNRMSSPPVALVVANVALLAGVPQSLAEARRLTDSDERYIKCLGDAGRLLMNARAYGAAADMLQDAASGQGAAGTMSLVKALRKAAQPPAARATLNGAQDRVLRLMQAFLAEHFTVENMRSFESRAAVSTSANATEEERNNLLEGSRQTRASAIKAGLKPSVLTDLSLQWVEIQTTGDDERGYRAVIELPGMRNQTYFIVKESGEYKILASDAHPAALGIEALDRLDRGDKAGAMLLLDWLREISSAEGGDDPYGGNPFARVWTPGHGAVDSGQISLAAASILVQSAKTAKRGVDTIEKLSADPNFTGPRDAIDLGLMLGYLELKQFDRALEHAEHLTPQAPLSLRVFNVRETCLIALGRYADATSFAQSRIDRLPADGDALRILGAIELAQHHYIEAYGRLVQAVVNPNSKPGLMNDAAWFSVFAEPEKGPDVDMALRAAQSLPNDGKVLHTLATVYAEAGKLKESKDALTQSLNLRYIEEPTGDYWYVLGRIAEQCEEPEIARSYYDRVKPPADRLAEPSSSYHLAQRRLHDIQVTANAK